jgi:hypothetical protein
MNGPIDPTILQNNPAPTMPAIFQAFSRPAPLLPGENLHDFESIRAIIINDINPQSGLEWLWTMDLIDISWDIVRYRSLRQKVLETYREVAIESVLQRLDLAGIRMISCSWRVATPNKTLRSGVQIRKLPPKSRCALRRTGSKQKRST